MSTSTCSAAFRSNISIGSSSLGSAPLFLACSTRPTICWGSPPPAAARAISPAATRLEEPPKREEGSGFSEMRLHKASSRHLDGLFCVRETILPASQRPACRPVHVGGSAAREEGFGGCWRRRSPLSSQRGLLLWFLQQQYEGALGGTKISSSDRGRGALGSHLDSW
jgi:hypothetical protein